jgi:methylenetetrahydrofolate reductase (NADPH)
MRIADQFSSLRPTISFEFFPPKTPEGVEALYCTMSAELAPLSPTFVSVTYGAGGSTQHLTVELVTNIKRSTGIEAMCHLTCVGQTARKIAAVLDQLRANGIENVLTLRGDPPRGQAEFVRPEGGFGYAQELARFVRSRYDFCLGGGAYPEGHPDCPDPDQDLQHLKEKVASGVEFLITQLFFEPDLYFRFVDRARAIGIAVPIVPGILPVLSLPQIERFTSLCGASIPAALRARLEGCATEDETIQVGIDWATNQCEALLAGGAPGLHFYTLNRARSAKAILENLGLVPVRS